MCPRPPPPTTQAYPSPLPGSFLSLEGAPGLRLGWNRGLPGPCPIPPPQAPRLSQSLSRQSFPPTAGRTTTNEELEDMLESGKLAIFTDDVSPGWGWGLFLGSVCFSLAKLGLKSES